MNIWLFLRLALSQRTSSDRTSWVIAASVGLTQTRSGTRALAASARESMAAMLKRQLTAHLKRWKPTLLQHAAELKSCMHDNVGDTARAQSRRRSELSNVLGSIFPFHPDTSI